MRFLDPNTIINEINTTVTGSIGGKKNTQGNFYSILEATLPIILQNILSLSTLSDRTEISPVIPGACLNGEEEKIGIQNTFLLGNVIENSNPSSRGEKNKDNVQSAIQKAPDSILIPDLIAKYHQNKIDGIGFFDSTLISAENQSSPSELMEEILVNTDGLVLQRGNTTLSDGNASPTIFQTNTIGKTQSGSINEEKSPPVNRGPNNISKNNIWLSNLINDIDLLSKYSNLELSGDHISKYLNIDIRSDESVIGHHEKKDFGQAIEDKDQSLFNFSKRIINTIDSKDEIDPYYQLAKIENSGSASQQRKDQYQLHQTEVKENKLPYKTLDLNSPDKSNEQGLITQSESPTVAHSKEKSQLFIPVFQRMIQGKMNTNFSELDATPNKQFMNLNYRSKISDIESIPERLSNKILSADLTNLVKAKGEMPHRVFLSNQIGAPNIAEGNDTEFYKQEVKAHYYNHPEQQKQEESIENSNFTKTISSESMKRTITNPIDRTKDIHQHSEEVLSVEVNGTKNNQSKYILDNLNINSQQSFPYMIETISKVALIQSITKMVVETVKKNTQQMTFHFQMPDQELVEISFIRDSHQHKGKIIVSSESLAQIFQQNLHVIQNNLLHKGIQFAELSVQLNYSHNFQYKENSHKIGRDSKKEAVKISMSAPKQETLAIKRIVQYGYNTIEYIA